MISRKTATGREDMGMPLRHRDAVPVNRRAVRLVILMFAAHKGHLEVVRFAALDLTWHTHEACGIRWGNCLSGCRVCVLHGSCSNTALLHLPVRGRKQCGQKRGWERQRGSSWREEAEKPEKARATED